MQGLRFKAADSQESRRFRWRQRTEVRQQMAATFDGDYPKGCCVWRSLGWTDEGLAAARGRLGGLGGVRGGKRQKTCSLGEAHN